MCGSSHAHLYLFHMSPNAQRQGYRVVKAHFKSSHCPVCSKEFIPGACILAIRPHPPPPRAMHSLNPLLQSSDLKRAGEHIAKPAGDKGRGGWAHSVCLANQLQEGSA